MSYQVPPPFNIIPTAKSVWYIIKWVCRQCVGDVERPKKEHMKTIRVRVLFIPFERMLVQFSRLAPAEKKKSTFINMGRALCGTSFGVT